MRRLIDWCVPGRALRWRNLAPSAATWAVCRAYGVPPWVVL